MDLEDLDSGEGVFKFSDFFEAKSLIGQGAFGKVVLAVDRNTGEECAVKIIYKKTLKAKELERLRKESQILSTLKHPNIVKFFNVKETKRRVLIVMEYVRGGTLKQLIEHRYKVIKTGFTEEEASALLKHILAAVNYMHLVGIFHRDLKPENILIGNRDDFSTLKIADFGLSAQFLSEGHTQIFIQQCGTLAFMSPELAQEKFYTKEVDIWSCGIIMYILLTGKHPLLKRQDNTKSFLQKLTNPNWELDNTNFSQLAKNLFLKLVQLEPTERYSAAKAFSHPWITRKFEDDIPLSAHETMVFFEQQQILKRVVKAMCFMLYVTKGKDTQRGCSSQYREIVSKVCTEVHGQSRLVDSFNKNHSKSVLAGLLGSNSDMENKQSRSPRKNFSPKMASKIETSLERSLYSLDRGISSVCLDKPDSRISDIGPEKIKASSISEDRKITASSQQDIAQTSTEKGKNFAKESEFKAIGRPTITLPSDKSSVTVFQNTNLKTRRKSEILILPIEYTASSPREINNTIRFSDALKIHSSKNADELKREREQGFKSYFSRKTDNSKNSVSSTNAENISALLSNFKKQNPNLAVNQEGFGDLADLHTFRKPNEAVRAPLTNIKVNNRLSSIRDSNGNLQRILGDQSSSMNDLRESQFKKSLLQKVIAARESCDENSPKLVSKEQNFRTLKRGNSTHQAQILANSTTEREKTHNPTPISLEPSIKPFSVEHEGEKSPNTPSFQREKAGNFRFQKKRMGKPEPTITPIMKKNTVRDTPEGRRKLVEKKIDSLQNLPKYHASKSEIDTIQFPQKPLVSKLKKQYFENHKKLIQKADSSSFLNKEETSVLETN